MLLGVGLRHEVVRNPVMKLEPALCRVFLRQITGHPALLADDPPRMGEENVTLKSLEHLSSRLKCNVSEMPWEEGLRRQKAHLRV